MPEPGNEPQNESCPATRDARGIAPIPCALPLGHAGEHRSKGGTTWAEIVPPNESRYGEFGTCSLCGGGYDHWGNSPEPLKHYSERCCDTCNWNKVIPARLERIQRSQN